MKILVDKWHLVGLYHTINFDVYVSSCDTLFIIFANFIYHNMRYREQMNFNELYWTGKLSKLTGTKWVNRWPNAALGRVLRKPNLLWFFIFVLKSLFESYSFFNIFYTTPFLLLSCYTVIHIPSTFTVKRHWHCWRLQDVRTTMKTRTRTEAKLYIPSTIETQTNFVCTFVVLGQIGPSGQYILKTSAFS